MYDLPKWPQMRVVGLPLSPSTALEIIRRTDTFFHAGWGGMNIEWNEWVAKTLSMPVRYLLPLEEWQTYHTALSEWRNKWKLIDTEYVSNSWVSCSTGPRGWCSPNGEIYYADNIGTWPSYGEIIHDWERIAVEFPSIVADVVIMNGDSLQPDAIPVFGINIRNGSVTYTSTVTEDSMPMYYESWKAKPVLVDDPKIVRIAFGKVTPLGVNTKIGIQQIIEWAEQYK